MDESGIERLDDMEEGIRRAAQDAGNAFTGMHHLSQTMPFVIYDKQTARKSLITACHFFHKFKGFDRCDCAGSHAAGSALHAALMPLG